MVVTVASGYYINAAQAGEPPGRWWGTGAKALGLTPGQIVDRVIELEPVTRQRPGTGTAGRLMAPSGGPDAPIGIEHSVRSG